MDYIPWDDSFLVGIDAFDNDHRYLVKLINNLHSGLMSGFGVSEMTYILDDLIHYTNVHFKREEDMMRKFSYPEFYKHESAHADLVRQVLDFQAQLKAGKKVFSIELMGFLRDWLINHILKTDGRYAGFFKQHAGVGLSRS
jgi:hemerythrin-like metal-binding protein